MCKLFGGMDVKPVKVPPPAAPRAAPRLKAPGDDPAGVGPDGQPLKKASMGLTSLRIDRPASSGLTIGKP